MVKPIEGTKNGYFIDGQYSNLSHVIQSYGKDFRCFICNAETAKIKELKLFTKSKITINKNLEDGVFYINGIF